MSIALSPTPAPPSIADPILDLHNRVEDWSDPFAIAAAVVDVLRTAVPAAAIAVYSFDRSSNALLMLGSECRGRGASAVGARLHLREDAIASAVIDGELRRTINSYVRPDFVRSLPGETRSELAAPIRAGSEVVGVLHLEYTSGQRPSAADESLVTTLAFHLAPVFAAGVTGHSGAGEDVGRKLEQASQLATLASHLAHTGDLPGILQRLAETALHLVDARAAVVLLRHESRQMLEVGATAGEALANVGELIPLDKGVASEVVRSGKPGIVDPIGTDQDSFSPIDAERGIRDALVVPLSAAGKSYGALAVLNRTEGKFTAEDVDLLQGLANQGAAIEAMRSIAPLRQQLSDSSLIAEVGRAVTGTLGLDEVLAVVVRAAEMLVSARCAAVALLNDDRTTLQLAATSGSLMTRQGDSFPVHGSLTGWAVLEGRTVTSPGIGEDARRADGEAKLGAGAIVPIESGSRVHGALLVARAIGAPQPSDGDLDALRKLAAYAAIAIENARLYREQTELSNKLRTQTEELEKAYADLRTSQDRLLVSEKMAALGRVTAGIAHEINSPLGGILNCLQMAQTYIGEYRASISDPEVTADDHQAIANDLTEAITLAEHSTRKVAQFVRTIKGQTRTGEELRTDFDPNEEIDGVIAVLQHELRSRNVTLDTHIEPGISLTGDPGKFSLVLQNLLKNAIDAYEGREGVVGIRWGVGSSGRAVLSVEDKGCGISQSIRGRIYDYLFTTKDIGQGTGLGLSTVHSIVTTHFEGEIEFESEEGVGTTFSVTFPTSPVKD